MIWRLLTACCWWKRAVRKNNSSKCLRSIHSQVLAGATQCHLQNISTLTNAEPLYAFIVYTFHRWYPKNSLTVARAMTNAHQHCIDERRKSIPPLALVIREAEERRPGGDWLSGWVCIFATIHHYLPTGRWLRTNDDDDDDGRSFTLAYVACGWR